jgi:hypothetical protein
MTAQRGAVRVEAREEEEEVEVEVEEEVACIPYMSSIRTLTSC